MIAEQDDNFWKDCGKCFSPIKLMKDAFEWMSLKEIEHSKSLAKHRTPKNTKIYLYTFCFSAKSSMF